MKNVFAALLLSGAVLLSAVPLAATAASSAAAQEELKPVAQPIPLSLARVKKVMGTPGVYLFDCNPQDIYEQSHIAGSTHINVQDWKALLPKDKKNAYLIFYCINRMCTISWETAKEALAEGYYNVYVMPDGIQGWVSNGYEFEGAGRHDKALEERNK